MANIVKMKAVAESIPNYPGRQQAERVVRPLVEFVGGRWIRREAERQVTRLVGFHALWHELHAQGERNPVRAMFERGIMGERTAFDCGQAFRIVFGAGVEELTHAEVLRAACGVRPVELPGAGGRGERGTAGESAGGRSPAETGRRR